MIASHARTILCLVCLSTFLHAQKWETLADIPEKLTYPVVTVLNGKIHVMGGGGAAGATTSHYRYDPATNHWDTLAPVPYKAQQPAGAANNGAIHYFGGGYPNSGTPLDKHYVYSPQTNSWSAAASLTKKRALGYAVSVNNHLYSLAGQGSETLCQIYNDTLDTWTTLGPLPDSKFWYGAHIEAAGKIYRFCGGGYTAPVNTVNEYDPTTDTWSTLEAFPEAVHGIDGAAVGDRIYLFGGYYNKQESYDAWIYDTKTQQYFLGIPLPAARYYHRVVAIGNSLYCVGGYNSLDANAAASLMRLTLKSGSTDVTHENADLSTQMYPNPASSTLVMHLADGVESARIELIDVLGRIVMSSDVASSSTSLSVEALSAGVYSARVTSRAGVTVTPLCVQH